MRWMIGFLAALTLLALHASAQAPRRVALVIGNGAYSAQAPLSNPLPDARLVAEALRRAGFQVTAQTDLGKAAMDRTLRDFARTADAADVALVYFAGHGIEANGVNWLLPVDATLAFERDLSFEAMSLDTVLGAVENARGLRMVVLDACRNNPFTRTMRRGTSSTRSVSRGLAEIEVTGTLVLYAARGGSVAQDGPPGGNSPFALALARRIPEPGVDIRILASKVRDDVLAATNQAQEPFSYGSLPGMHLELVSAGPGAAPAPPSPASVELAVWQGALSANSVVAFQDYLRRYPAGQFRTLAEQNIARLTPPAPQKAAVRPPVSTGTQFPMSLNGRWVLLRAEDVRSGSCPASIDIVATQEAFAYTETDLSGRSERRSWRVKAIADGRVTFHDPASMATSIMLPAPLGRYRQGYARLERASMVLQVPDRRCSFARE